MFYLLKRKSENQFSIGDKIMVLADFSGVPAGTKGIVSEIYDGGVMVAWIGIHDKTEQEVIQAMQDGQLAAYRGFLVDGFGGDDLEYLSVMTQTHPKLHAL